MIIRFSGPGDLFLLKEALEKFVPEAEVVRPILVATKHNRFEKVLLPDVDDDVFDDVIECLRRHNFGLPDEKLVNLRVSISSSDVSMRKQSDTQRKEMASKFYFIALRERGSFLFSRKEFWHNHRRIDGSFSGDVELESTLPEGFENWAEPEWYCGESATDCEEFEAADAALREAGFTELVRWGDQYLPRDPSDLTNKANLFYFIASASENAFYFVRKEYWDDVSALDETVTSDDDLDIALPPGFSHVSASEYHYRQRSAADFEKGRRYLLGSGFTELPESELP